MENQSKKELFQAIIRILDSIIVIVCLRFEETLNRGRLLSKMDRPSETPTSSSRESNEHIVVLFLNPVYIKYFTDHIALCL